MLLGRVCVLNGRKEQHSTNKGSFALHRVSDNRPSIVLDVRFQTPGLLCIPYLLYVLPFLSITDVMDETSL